MTKCPFCNVLMEKRKRMCMQCIQCGFSASVFWLKGILEGDQFKYFKEKKGDIIE